MNPKEKNYLRINQGKGIDLILIMKKSDLL